MSPSSTPPPPPSPARSNNAASFPISARPNVIRLAPIALYTTFEECWQTVQALREIVEAGEHLAANQGRELVA